MNARTTPDELRYELRVAGHLDDHWADWLGGLVLNRLGDGTSSLTGPFTDQAQLHGVLQRLRDLGVPILALHTGGVPPGPTLAHPLRTRRLTLRPATPADADAVFGYRRLEAVGRWLTEMPSDPEAHRTRFSEPDRLASTVIVEREGRLVGDFMLRVEDAWAQAEVADRARGSQAELGWVLDPAHTGHGYATEAGRALLGHCFDELGVRRVVASCFLANVASWCLMERLGMRREVHAVAQSLHRSGEWLDVVGYALLASEWDPEA